MNSTTNKISPGNPSARSALLAEVLASFGAAHQPNPGAAVAAPATRSFSLENNYPNPFNPSTTLAFNLGRNAKGSVRIYNLRGELIRILASGDFPEGRNTLTWNGSDDRGTEVASGVYLINYQIDGTLVMNAEEFADLYLTGIPLVGLDGDRIPSSTIEEKILATTEELEGFLNAGIVGRGIRTGAAQHEDLESAHWEPPSQDSDSTWSSSGPRSWRPSRANHATSPVETNL